MCNCFVAEDRKLRRLIGCAFVSFLTPEALLPPPWPTLKPVRFYISNMAVLPDHRRRGVARALLQACERLGEHPAAVSVML
jgi:ribosomal protein S18 acetylase RimI-like enzyme